MTYLIFNQEGEMIDALVFNSEKELNNFKDLNPDFIVEEEGLDAAEFLDEDLEDEESENYNDIDNPEWL